MILPVFYVDEFVKRAVLEDVPYADMTTDFLIHPAQKGEAVFLAKEDCVLSGIDVALRTLHLMDPSAETEVIHRDQERLTAGTEIAKVRGSMQALLKGERTALNFMQRMSGIATKTAEAVKLVEGTSASIADTRKTTPTLRAFEKYAVMCGGGRNHRFCLSDAILIKDNHIDAVGSIKKAVEILRGKAGHTVKIEVEVRNKKELIEALEAKADIVMLDNMTCTEMKEAVEITAGRAALEASGNITAQTLRAVAETGVDIISIGALTHTFHSADISMKIKPIS